MVMEPGWPVLMDLMNSHASSPRNSASSIRSGFMRRQEAKACLGLTLEPPSSSRE
jgi:hypothetical protein